MAPVPTRDLRLVEVLRPEAAPDRPVPRKQESARSTRRAKTVFVSLTGSIAK